MKFHASLVLLSVIWQIASASEGSSREPKMSSVWRRQSRKAQGLGSFAVTGTAGGDIPEIVPPAGSPPMPTGRDCTEAGFFPSPGSCLHFYRCVDWRKDGTLFTAFSFTCPAGTVFDDVLDICNHPGWSGRPECGGSLPHPGPMGPTAQTSGQVWQTGNEGPPPQAGANTQTGVTVQTSAPVLTGDGSVTVAPTTPAGVVHLTCYKNKKYRAHPKFCNQYYYCTFVNEVWNVHTFTCQADLIFYEGSQTCARDTSATIDCEFATATAVTTQAIGTVGSEVVTTATPVEVTSAIVTTAATTATPSPGALFLTCYTDTKYRPHPQFCNQYYYCTMENNIWDVHSFTCPPNLIFDPENQLCIRKDTSPTPNCQVAPYSTPSSILPGEVTTASPVTAVDTTAEIVTTVSPGAETSPGVFSLTCYMDQKYRKHPRYCNQYYYCNLKDGVWDVPTFTCPTNLIFDEGNQICTRKDLSDTPDCEIAPYSTPSTLLVTTEATGTLEPAVVTTALTTAPVDTTPAAVDTTAPSVEEETTPSESSTAETTTLEQVTDGPAEMTTLPDEAVTDPPIDTTTMKTWEVDPSSLYDCPAPGYYPYEGDCERFYKCVETDLSQLKGLLYRCPTGYGYHEERQRCAKDSEMPPCNRVPQFAIRVETATPLYPEDLIWFFNSKR